MKEIIELHHKVLTQAAKPLPKEGFRFSRDDSDEEVDGLPEELLTAIGALQDALDPLIPDDFDYSVGIGIEAASPQFSLYCDESPAGSVEDGTFDTMRSLFDQLRLLDWDRRRQAARKNSRIFDYVMRMSARVNTPLPSAKQFQRAFREEAREFIKEKRKVTTKVHVFCWEEEGGLKELDFASLEALREALPDLVGNGAEIVTVVAGGKPLPVERIDALKAEAIRVFGDQPIPRFDDPEDAGNRELPL